MKRMNRRHFLAGASVGIAGMSVGSLAWLWSRRSKDRLPRVDWNGKVAVIGAGASGLYAAHLLVQAGVDVTILEASERAGGRIRKLEGFVDYPIELGAEFVNGSNHVLHQLARKSDVALLGREATAQDYFAIGGALFDEAEAEQHEVMAGIYELVSQIGVYDGPDMSLAAYIAQQDVSEDVIALSEIIGVETGGSNETVSVKAAAEMLETFLRLETEQAARPRTSYLDIFASVQETIADRVQYGRPVTAIDYCGDRIMLMSPDGTRETVDRVILTVPLGVLQRGLIAFEPVLPQAKQRAIATLEFGPGLKVILKFRNRFWNPDLNMLNGGRLATYWPPLGNRFSEDVTLTAFAVGEHATRLRNDPAFTPTELILSELDSLYGGAVATNQFLESYVVDWTDDPYIGGYVTVPKTPSTFNDKAELARSVDERLFFAGEATNLNPETLGYVHGAMGTGARAARELVNSVSPARQISLCIRD